MEVEEGYIERYRWMSQKMEKSWEKDMKQTEENDEKEKSWTLPVPRSADGSGD